MASPDGTDLTRAVALHPHLHERFPDEPIFRIDHCLGLTPARSILEVRFASGRSEPVENRHRIDPERIEQTAPIPRR